MNIGDREYFMLRARQERAAMLRSGGEVRRRHEELASAYQMRVTYIDAGLIGTDEPEQPAPIPHPLVA